MKRFLFVLVLLVFLMSGGIVSGENERFILPGDRPIDSVATGIAYVKVSDYFECGIPRFRDAIQEIKRKKLNSKVILDFRGSSVIDLDIAKEIIETFVGPGKIAYIEEGKLDKYRKEITTDYPKEDIRIGKIICLVDANTNIPSEIVVLALKYHLFDVITVGERTGGNIDSYRIYPSGIGRLSEDIIWSSSSGIRISNIGIIPAYEVTEKEQGRDLVIEKAVELLER